MGGRSNHHGVEYMEREVAYSFWAFSLGLCFPLWIEVSPGPRVLSLGVNKFFGRRSRLAAQRSLRSSTGQGRLNDCS